MARTMRNIVITCILLIVLAGAACMLVLNGDKVGSAFSTLSQLNPFSGAQTAATNALIDSSGMKDRVESELYAHADAIAARTGMPVEAVNEGIGSLAIQDWQAVEKPRDSSETGSYSVNADGTQVGVTTYADPSIVTVEAYGQEVTLAIPESAQDYLYLLPLIEQMQ